MKPFLKYLLLIAPLLPIVFFLMSKIPNISNSITDMQFSYSLLFLFFITIATMGAYAWHMANNKRMSRGEKVNWIFFFIFFMMGAQIAYWFRFMRHDDEQSVIVQ